MTETFKEKITRYVLVVIFVAITMVAFIYRQEKLTIQESAHHPHAIVLHTSIDENDNPVVLLYEQKNKHHILGVYEIEKRNRYKFNSRHVVYLDAAVDQLLLDQNENGFWVKSNKKWLFFNTNLQEEHRDFDEKRVRNPVITPFTFNEEKSTIMLNNKQTISLHSDDVPRELHMLSDDGSSWLVLTDKEVKIATIANEHSKNE